ncbi:phage tail assembly protein [Solimonas sp. SE-A11]|uniref:phage tail assembly protein n=1 Tax=Solimonas sp. SE-A11 TaxID=3054954 RepID=UPI00259C9B96|nr:phage tail assembly protein [Solimonas sp. SE-A11]MDM4768669.1 phage tail assembly protein [Solimonas sp. SE-A11]
MRTVQGTWKHGLKIGDKVHKTFVLREAEAGDFFDAEADAQTNQVLTFDAALACRQFVSIGDYTGPVLLQQVRKLKPVDLMLLRVKQKELDSQGEAPEGGEPGTGMPSSS